MVGTIIKRAFQAIIVICMVFMAGCSTGETAAPVENVDLSQDKKVVEAFGVIKAEEYMDVIIDFPSAVSEVLVSEGQHIALNEPILTLDLLQYESQLSDKESELSIAELEYEQIIKGISNMTLEDKENEINKLRNDLEFSEKLCLQSIEEFNSKEKLYSEGAVSQEAYNLSKLNLDESRKNAENLKYELSQATESLEREKEQLLFKKESERGKASVQTERIQQIKNNIDTLKSKLNKPYIIENQIVSQYENAAVYDIKYAAGHITDVSTKAFSIANLDSLIIEADVVEEFVKDIHSGAKVKIVPVADRSREYEGSVKYISKMAFSNNGETIVPIRISINDIDSFLLPNYNVDVYIDVQ